VFGTADANQFERAWVEIGQGVNPGEWKKAGAALSHSVKDGVVAEIPAAELQGAKLWTIKLVTQHKNGRKRENRFNLKLG